MANYLYKTTIEKNPTKILGLPSDQVQANIDAKDDFETNFKSQAVFVEEVTLAETTFVIDQDYTAFKSLIDGTSITWGAVKFTNGSGTYILNLLSDTTL